MREEFAGISLFELEFKQACTPVWEPISGFRGLMQGDSNAKMTQDRGLRHGKWVYSMSRPYANSIKHQPRHSHSLNRIKQP